MGSRVALVCVVVLSCASRIASAQSPRAGGPAPGDDPSSRIAAELAATGNLARGFVDRELISVRGIVQAWDGPWGLYIQAYWMYGRVGTPMGKITTDNEIYVRTGLFRKLTGPWFAYAVNAYDRSLRRKIEHRDLIGGGAGLNILQKPGISLLTSVGVLGEFANFTDGDVDSPMLSDGTIARGIREQVRWSVRLYGRYKIGGGKLALVHDLIVIPSFDAPTDDYRILFYAAIDAPIAKGFSARVQADATREGIIVEGTKRDDLIVSFGLSYRAEWTGEAATPSPAPPKPSP